MKTTKPSTVFGLVAALVLGLSLTLKLYVLTDEAFWRILAGLSALAVGISWRYGWRIRKIYRALRFDE